MTRDQWKALHRSVRVKKRWYPAGSFYLTWDGSGRLGLTQRHPKGHAQTQAAIANVLRHAAASRAVQVDHRIYLDRVRQLRKRGTWL